MEAAHLISRSRKRAWTLSGLFPSAAAPGDAEQLGMMDVALFPGPTAGKGGGTIRAERPEETAEEGVRDGRLIRYEGEDAVRGKGGRCLRARRSLSGLLLRCLEEERKSSAQTQDQFYGKATVRPAFRLFRELVIRHVAAVGRVRRTRAFPTGTGTMISSDDASPAIFGGFTRSTSKISYS